MSSSYLASKAAKFYSKLPRGDTWVAGLVPVGLVALLVEAHYRTEISTAEASTKLAFTASSNLIQDHHVRKLKEDGFIVLENAISPQLLEGARRDLLQWVSEEPDELKASANETNVRQDRIVWVAEGRSNRKSIEKDGSDDTTTDTVDQPPHKTSLTPSDDGIARVYGDSFVHCLRLVRGMTDALVQEGYTRKGSKELLTAPTTTMAKTSSPAESTQYLVPLQGQLAMYPGDGQALYHRHLDTCTSTLAELGLLEWLRLSDYRARSLTVILYLNTADRTSAEGGALRCWKPKEGQQQQQQQQQQPLLVADQDDNAAISVVDEDEGNYFDVIPRGGTMVIFESDKIEHMVLPSSTDRYALTSWVFRAE